MEYAAHFKDDRVHTNIQAIAHEGQSLVEHLQNTATLAGNHANKIGMKEYGELLGLLHDLGKYSNDFQKYILNAIKQNDPDFDPDEDEDYENPGDQRGKIDHSTAGAQLFLELNQKSNVHKILGQILTLCLVSHHSGLIDCLKTDNQGTWDCYSKRIAKVDIKTHKSECCDKIDQELLEQIKSKVNTNEFARPFLEMCKSIIADSPNKNPTSTIVQFQIGLLTRFLFSCLIDADRQDSADSENHKLKVMRQQGEYRSWVTLIERLENRYKQFSIRNNVDTIRKDIAEHCLKASNKNRGLFTLTVPTGGGKTLASLRFALHHTKKHGLDRIIYVIPFTSIIDQNAQVVREILEPDDSLIDKGKIVLENHSNIGAEKQSWKEKLLTENWDAPVVYTTMVQLLETLFGAGTRGARRMHQLANSVIIFDEIQTLPIKCVHMFNNAINFLVNQCGSSVVLCTATQPLLGEVNKQKGSLNLTNDNEIMPDVAKLFAELKRVSVEDLRTPTGWSYQEIAELSVKQINEMGSCLVIVNTKKAARSIFEQVSPLGFEIFHLSTGMCPAHRKEVLNEIRIKLNNREPILCISTQLIEAGVDVDFGAVIRMLAGLDSIAQAAGRCNRNGERETGKVLIVNPSEEKLDCLVDISVGKEKSNRVLDDFKKDEAKYCNDRISPKMLDWYYQNYFYERQQAMDYPIEYIRNDTMLNLLSANSMAVAEFGRINRTMPVIDLKQSFMTAAKLFKSIDAPTQSVIVQYGEKGKEVVNKLCSAFDLEKQYSLIKEAQQYSVNLFPHEYKKLVDQNALHTVQEGTEIFYLDNKYYSTKFGISLEPVNSEELLYV